MNRKVIGIGETVLDIIFRGNQPISAVPGGSTYNACISLGRAGIETTFISVTGNDRVGRNIIDFLKENGVNADNVNIFPDSKSPLSLAFLDICFLPCYLTFLPSNHMKTSGKCNQENNATALLTGNGSRKESHHQALTDFRAFLQG